MHNGCLLLSPSSTPKLPRTPSAKPLYCILDIFYKDTSKCLHLSLYTNHFALNTLTLIMFDRYKYTNKCVAVILKLLNGWNKIGIKCWINCLYKYAYMLTVFEWIHVHLRQCVTLVMLVKLLLRICLPSLWIEIYIKQPKTENIYTL